MNTETLDRMERLFRAALLHPTEERADFLEAACADDPELRSELESLLNADEEADDQAFLEERADLNQGMLDDGAQESDFREEQIGPYTLLRLLGHGGMGDVYLALRQKPFKQYAALKLIRRGMDTGDIQRRFTMERQILASLNHPHIAKLLDGGVTEDGRSYFVMEYVEGKPLNTYCDEDRLGVDERIRLFRAVCRAVHYAHQNLVIHRDLKPSNIMVTQAGTVKLLDFGVAKLLNPGLSQMDVPITRTEVRVMTPAYASPEQVRGDSLTTASDIYSLGVLLYELLTGHRPYRFKSQSSADIEQVVCGQDPERPSTKVSKEETITHYDGTKETITPAAVSQARDATVERLHRRLRGDLDNIVMMALHKGPSRRYNSAEQLSQDLERYLAGQPVEARPSTMGYRVSKFVARNRVGVMAAALVLLSLVSALGVSLWRGAQVRHERDRAQIEAQKSDEVKEFVLSLFESADPRTTLSDTIRVRDVLETGATRIASELSEQPEVQAEMMSVIGRAFRSLGRADRAEPLLKQALALNRQTLGDLHEETTASLLNLADLYESRHDLDRAEPLYREYLALQRERLGEGHKDVMMALHQLGLILHMSGQAAEGDSLMAVWHTFYQEYPQQDDPDLARSLSDMAAMLRIKGELEEAETLARQSLAMTRRLFGNQHHSLVEALSVLGVTLNLRKKFTEAEPINREAVTLSRLLYPQGHFDVSIAQTQLVETLIGLARYEEAERLLLDDLDLRRNLFGETHFRTARSYSILAQLAQERNRYREAEAWQRKAVALYETLFGAENLITLQQREWLADILRAQERYAEAEQILLDVYQRLETKRGSAHKHTQQAGRHLIKLYEAWGRPEEAERYRPEVPSQ